MGWAKYTEDIRDAIDDSHYMRMVKHYSLKKTEPPEYCCMYCNLSFYNKSELYEHIRQKHGMIKSILFVNGKVSPNEMYVKSLRSIKLITYELTTPICLCGKVYKNSNNEYELNLLDNVKQFFEENKEVTIEIGNRCFIVRKIEKNSINHSMLSAVVEKWNEEISTVKHISMVNDTDLNDIEKRCVNGLFNYYLAAITADEKDKGNRYNDAYAILTEFIDILPIARTILKVIAFRYNWADRLDILCSENDIFRSIHSFYINEKTNCQIEYEDGASKVFIEDELEILINIISAYQNNNMYEVDAFISNYPIKKVMDIRDVNQRDKICLLAARRKKLKSRNEARRYYFEIQSPCFDGEKSAYIKEE